MSSYRPEHLGENRLRFSAALRWFKTEKLHCLIKVPMVGVGLWFLFVAVGAVAADVAADLFLPAESLNLKLAAPIDTWDEAIPLGNGLLGGLLWGKDGTIRLSLDRGDLWDTRVPDEFKREDFTWKTMQRLVAEKNQAELISRLETPFRAPGPTKLPGGRLEISLDPSQRVASFSLDLAHAVGCAELGNGVRLETFFSATAPVALMRIPGPTLKEWKLIAPTAVKSLGYPEAKPEGEGDAKWFVQQTLTGFRYAVVAAACRDGKSTLLALTITTSDDGPDPVKLGRKRLAEAVKRGYANMLAPHEAWWREFWRKSRVELPELNHLRHYYLCSISTARPRGQVRRRCRFKVCGLPTTAAFRRGRASMPTT